MSAWSRLSGLALTYSGYIKRVEECSYYPTRLWIEVTSNCNLKCGFCGNRQLTKEQRGNMDFDLYRRITDECAGKVGQFNLFHRGESLLHPRLAEMIVYAGQRGIRTRINTNATLLSNSTAKELINAQLDIITFSFDGYDAETYEANRPNACFEKSLGNILGFLAMKKELGSAKPFVGLEVMEIADKSSEVFAKERRAFLKQFEGLPLDKFILRRQHNWAGMIDTGRQAPSTRIACPLLWHALVVFWDGRVLPCPQDFFGALELGNANEQGIMEIWNGFELRQLRREMANPNTLSRHPCVECDRIMRRTFAGVPTDYLGRFLSENVFGNSWLSRILPH